MKTLCVRLSIVMVWALVACGCGSDGSEGGASSSIRALLEREIASGSIASEGEVDWYSFNAVEANRTLTVNCRSTYRNSPVDFMLTVYEKDAQ